MTRIVIQTTKNMMRGYAPATSSAKLSLETIGIKITIVNST
jgi:hypothetical protein